MIGPHVSVSSKTFYADINSYYDKGLDLIQIFMGNPRQAFDKGLEEVMRQSMYNYLPIKVVCHASYVVSLCRTYGDPLYHKSMNHLVYLSKVCNSVGIEEIVTHIGGVAIDGTVKEGMGNIKQFCLNWLRETRNHNTVLCLETDPGSSTGRKIGVITVLYKLVKEINNPRIRLCVDTEHIYASGYNLEDSELNSKMLEVASVVHLNTIPSYVELGSHLDRHSKDLIRDTKNEDSLKMIYQLAKEKGLPMILERNVDLYENDLDYIREEWD